MCLGYFEYKLLVGFLYLWFFEMVKLLSMDLVFSVYYFVVDCDGIEWFRGGKGWWW